MKEHTRSILLKTVLAAALLLHSLITLAALREGNRYWPQVDLIGSFPHHKNVLYNLDDQNRFDATQNEYERVVLLAGLGYRYLPSLTTWMGYQYNSQNAMFPRDTTENRAWENITFELPQKESIDFSLISRLEQIKKENQVEWIHRLREKMIIKIPKGINKNLTPVLTDEIFIHLNNPTWSHVRSNIGQNRAFAGVDIVLTKRCYVELGYLNQFIFTQPHYEMNNIIWGTFNISRL